jgi:ATP/maltotriose-dependent transcriptional regulator MalT/DNA-binding SARP family transcriptional activator
MASKPASFAKITRPIPKGIIPRERLFQILDAGREHPIVWISGPAGSGRTSLVSSYIDVRKIPCLWYQIDERDADVAEFFYYMTIAAKEAAPRKRKPLPPFSPEYLPGISAFTRRYFEDLFSRLAESVKERHGESANRRKEETGNRRTRETKNYSSPALRVSESPSRFMIVFDNYQDVPDGSGFQEMIINGLDVIPNGIQVILLSRNEPPPELARLRANNRVYFVGWNDLRLTLEESREIFRMKGPKRLSDEALPLLHERTDGWAAGLMLLLEKATQRDIESGVISKLPGLSHEAVFDYLASEIFVKADRDTQIFWLKTAFLPGITLSMAEKITGIYGSGQILSKLSRSNLLTERLSSVEPTYQYHPLLRAFLLSRAKDLFSPEEIHKVQQTAGRILEESALVEEGAELFIEAGDWTGIGGLIQRNAQSLLGQGRIKTLEGWLLRIPQDVMENSPWLLYWLGTCRMPFSLTEGRICFEKAFSLFTKENNPAGEFLAWSGVVDSYVYEWSYFTPLDRWIALLDELLDRHEEFPSAEIEARVASSIFVALLYRQPQHRKIAFWKDRLNVLVLRMEDSRQRIMMGSSLVHYSVWVGDFARAKWLVDLLRPVPSAQEVEPLLMLWWFNMESGYLWVTGDFNGCLATVAKGLEIASSRGVHQLDLMLLSQGAYGALSAGDLDAGAEFLGRMKSVMNPVRRMDVAHYHFLAGWEAVLRDDVPHAAEHIQSSLAHTKNDGSPFPQALSHFGTAQILMSRREYAEAKNHIVEALRIGQEMNSSFLNYVGLLAEARLAMEQDEEPRCLTALRSAMELGKRWGFVNHPWWLPSVMARLCAKALDAGIEVDYVQDLIRKRNLSPPTLPFNPTQPSLTARGGPPSSSPLNLRGDKVGVGIWLENWPWPLKIYTLGRFEIEKDGKPVSFAGKVQRVPLLLLKAVIALGAKDVKEEDLADLLWPEADGDLAHDSFRQTLSRLRQLLGLEKALRFQEGKATLDPRYCWVDLWTFERMHEQAEKLWKDSPHLAAGSDVFKLTEKAIELYRGHFLLGETEHYWLLPLRGRLKRKILSLISRLAHYYAEKGEWRKAAEYYEQGLEADNLAEELYQRLMVCYYNLGLRGEAMSVYKRCKETLLAIEGAEPSLKTQAIYVKIKENP